MVGALAPVVAGVRGDGDPGRSARRGRKARRSRARRARARQRRPRGRHRLGGGGPGLRGGRRPSALSSSGTGGRAASYRLALPTALRHLGGQREQPEYGCSDPGRVLGDTAVIDPGDAQAPQLRAGRGRCHRASPGGPGDRRSRRSRSRVAALARGSRRGDGRSSGSGTPWARHSARKSRSSSLSVRSETLILIAAVPQLLRRRASHGGRRPGESRVREQDRRACDAGIVTDRTESELERDFLALCRAHGVPEPEDRPSPRRLPLASAATRDRDRRLRLSPGPPGDAR